MVIEPDEDFDGNASGWHAHCPALDRVGGSTWGATREEVLKNSNEVAEAIEEGSPLPEGPEESVVVEEVSQEQPRISITA